MFDLVSPAPRRPIPQRPDGDRPSEPPDRASPVPVHPGGAIYIDAADLVQTSVPPIPNGLATPIPTSARGRRRVVATLLVALAPLGLLGCERGKALASGGEPGTDPADERVGPRTDLSQKHQILFQVFGERDDPRLIPIAIMRNGGLERIELDADGWKQFDGTYMRSPSPVTLYHDGRPIGAARVRQGMWERAGEPLYTLPSCRVLTPLAALALGDGVKAGFTVEYLASNAEIAPRPRGAPMDPEIATRAAREVAYGVGDRADIPASALDSLDFRAVAINTGATAEPTLVASFIDPGASEGAGEGTARHVLAIADRSGDRYAATFAHAVNAPSANAAYRRYVDHLDVTGDGIDEIILEGWQSGGDTYLLVLGYRSGRWDEIFRGRGSWCVQKGR